MKSLGYKKVEREHESRFIVSLDVTKDDNFLPATHVAAITFYDKPTENSG